MFYATGDTHGNWERLSGENFPQGGNLSLDDYLFILGDFGIWDDSPRERQVFDQLAGLPYNICFVSGNHENYDMLDQMPVEEWHGGKVNFIRDNIIHLRRGQVFTVNGMKIFTFGGASCHDIHDGILDVKDPEFRQKKKKLDMYGGMYRVNHYSWWKQELPTREEMQEGIDNLKQHDWKVDYIFSHCTATGIQKELTGEVSVYRPDILTEYLEVVRQHTDYQWWMFGHYHCNSKLSDKEYVLYEQIVRIPDNRE